MTPRRTALLAGTFLAALVTLAGCSAPAEPDGQASIAPSEVPSSPAPEPAPTEAAPLGDPTCETIIPEATAADFASLGWSVQVEPFRIGATQVPDGIQCKWGDHSITTDRVQVFGWAPIDAAEATAAQDELVASGWIKETSGTEVYVSENPDWAISKDSDGYGITYLFGDGWVKLADTRQSLVLVEWPPA